MPVPEFIADLRQKIGHDALWLPGVTAAIFKQGTAGVEVLLPVGAASTADRGGAHRGRIYDHLRPGLAQADPAGIALCGLRRLAGSRMILPAGTVGRGGGCR